MHWVGFFLVFGVINFYMRQRRSMDHIWTPDDLEKSDRKEVSLKRLYLSYITPT